MQDFPTFLRNYLKQKYICAMVFLKEVRTMKNAKEMVAALAKHAAEKAIRRDANRTSCNLIYQPKIPNGLYRFKKEKR